MRSSHVHDNRILLAVALSAVAAVALMVSVKLLAAPREAPLLMSVLGTSLEETAPARSIIELPPEVTMPESARMVAEGGVELPVEVGDGTRWFNGRPVRPARTMSMLVTAYSPDARSCGKHADGITASGYSVWTNGMRLVAADTKVLPFGSLVSVPGYGAGEDGEIVPVLDRGGKIKGNRLDVLYPTHEIARRWGAQRLEVTVWEYADGEPSGFRTQH